MSRARHLGLAAVLAAALGSSAGAGGGPYLIPAPYLSAADSPFPLGDGGYCLENFEDGTLDQPGVSGNGSLVAPGSITDSVDGDDGAIDGSGNGGHTYFGDGQTGITFTFDPARAGGLPTQAGMAWTDGAGVISFEAFDENGASLGVYGPFDHADNNITGETAEDRFYGVTNAAGIMAIKLTNTAGGIEVDHLQFNHCAGSSTTTTLPGGCGGVPDGATFASLNCRLAALIAAVESEAQLGNLQSKLLKAARKAKTGKETAETKCTAAKTNAARKQLKKVVRRLIQFSHRLRSHSAAGQAPETVREPLAAAADAIQSDARALKDSLFCRTGVGRENR